MPDDFTDEFADADLRDRRRSRRLGKVATALAKSPAASISAASGGWSETMAAYRLLNGDDFSPDASKLFAALEAAPILGEIEFNVHARKGTKKAKEIRWPLTAAHARCIR